MSEKVEKLLTRLGNIWPKRIDDDALEEWLADWEGVLKSYEPWVVEAAASRIVHTRTKPMFPLPGEVAEVCRQVVAEDRRAKPEMKLDTKQDANPYALAAELIRCDLGRRAAREGWVLTLRDFVVKERRLPAENEIKRLIAIRDKFQQDLIDCIDGNGGVCGAALAKLGRTMAKREYEIAQRVLGPSAEDWYATRL